LEVSGTYGNLKVVKNLEKSGVSEDKTSKVRTV